MIYGWGVVGSAVARRPHDIKCYRILDTHVHVKLEATICFIAFTLRHLSRLMMSESL